jgi:ABC-type nitrate/sulfonate/bicarbonate transport system permease component
MSASVTQASTVRRPRPATPTRAALVRWALGLLGLLMFAIIWQLVARSLDSPVFPRLTTTLVGFAHLFRTETLKTAVLPSVVRELVGFAISGVLGVGIGLLLGYNRTAAEWLSAVLGFARALPYPLLLPLAIVIIGLNSWTVIALIVTGAIWPVLVNTADAARAVDPLTHEVVAVCGLSRVHAFRKVFLPAILPEIMAGLRVALGISLALMVVAEMLGATDGLGHLIVSAESVLDSQQTYAGVVLLGVFGWCLDTVFLIVEHRAIKWKAAV